jgi:2-dehydro-3-deoxygluconokinase
MYGLVMVGLKGGEGSVSGTLSILIDRNQIVANRNEDTIGNWETRYNSKTFCRICKECGLLLAGRLTKSMCALGFQMQTYDVVALGETMLRFSPDGNDRLEQAGSMQVHVGGSESNTAVGLARLGHKVAWLSRLTDNPLGRTVASAIRSQGVDVSHVVWTDRDRVGLYFLESGPLPRGSRVIYDRENSAYARLRAEELPADLFSSGRSKWLLVTGISLALGESTRQLIAHAVSLARKAGWKIAFDVNHRRLLCTIAEARDYFDELFRTCDLLFAAYRDVGAIWGMDCGEDYRSAMTKLLAYREGRHSVMTLSSHGAIAGVQDEICMQRIEPVEPIGRLGGGDAFSAGYLHAQIEGLSLSASLRWSTAVARLKYTIPGDLPLIDRAEVEAIMELSNQTGAGLVR